MVTVVLVLVVVSLLGVVSVKLADQNTTMSARGRDRVAATHAAESGVNFALAEMSKSDGATTCVEEASSVRGLPVGDGPGSQAYTVEVFIPDPATGAPRPCASVPESERTSIAQRLIVATGADPDGAGRTPTRVVEAQVELSSTLPPGLSPGEYHFTEALYSGVDNPLLLTGSRFSGSLDINESRSGMNDAHVYTGSPLKSGNVSGAVDIDIEGNLTSQGQVRLNGDVQISGSVFAKGDIELGGDTDIGGSVTSSEENVTISGSSQIAGVVRAGKSITGGPVLAPGSLQPNSPSPIPEVRHFPEVPSDWSGHAWAQNGRYFPFDSCTAFTRYFARDTHNVRRDLRGVYHVKAPCVAELPYHVDFSNADYLLTGPTAIVVEGCFFSDQDDGIQPTIERSSAARSRGDKLMIVSNSSSGCGSNPGIILAGKGDYKTIPALYYARNKIKFDSTSGGGHLGWFGPGGSNVQHVRGQVYAQRGIESVGDLIIDYEPIVPPGFIDVPDPDATPWKVKLIYLREVNAVG